MATRDLLAHQTSLRCFCVWARLYMDGISGGHVLAWRARIRHEERVSKPSIPWTGAPLGVGFSLPPLQLYTPLNAAPRGFHTNGGNTSYDPGSKFADHARAPRKDDLETCANAFTLADDADSLSLLQHQHFTSRPNILGLAQRPLEHRRRLAPPRAPKTNAVDSRSFARQRDLELRSNQRPY